MKKFILIFISLCVVPVILGSFGFDLRHENYWQHHGFILLVFLTFFPRLALFFSSIPFGGFFWWLGFFFFPRTLVAFLATLNYWHENPFLVTLAWFIAIGGESTEKYFIKRRVYYYKQNPSRRDDNIIDVEASDIR